jgi:hypothetical protein
VQDDVAEEFGRRRRSADFPISVPQPISSLTIVRGSCFLALEGGRNRWCGRG